MTSTDAHLVGNDAKSSKSERLPANKQESDLNTIVNLNFHGTALATKIGRINTIRLRNKCTANNSVSSHLCERSSLQFGHDEFSIRHQLLLEEFIHACL